VKAKLGKPVVAQRGKIQANVSPAHW